MIIVTGSILTSEATFDEVLSVSLAHVQRSRTEPGCLAHNVHVDAENSLRLVFVEEWVDLATLHTHFAAPASRDFAQTARRLAAEPPVLKIYEVSNVLFG